MTIGSLLPYEPRARRRRPDRVHVAKFGVSQQWVLLDENLITVLLQQTSDRLPVLLLIHLDDELTNFGPIPGTESQQYIQLAFFDVNLEQVDPVNALVCDDAG